MSTPSSPARLHVFLAREAPYGLILRRGPAKQVCTIGWDRTNDSFELGQWIKGRIYEHRCDLSPDGRHFLYFAAKHKDVLENNSLVRFGNWTAVSRAPYLKALAFWGQSNTYGGGGHFQGNQAFWLNGDSETAVLEGLSKIPQPFAPWPWGMSDDDIYYFRLQREGWQLKDAPLSQHDIALSQKRISLWEKKRNAWTLQQFARYGENPIGRGSFWEWYRAHDNVSHTALGGQEWEWADFDGNRLVWAQGGKLFAMKIWDGGRGDVVELADFNDWTFQAIKAPYKN